MLQTDLHFEIPELAAGLHTEIRKQKVALIKWFVGLFLTLMIVGLYAKS